MGVDETATISPGAGGGRVTSRYRGWSLLAGCLLLVGNDAFAEREIRSVRMEARHVGDATDVDLEIDVADIEQMDELGFHLVSVGTPAGVSGAQIEGFSAELGTQSVRVVLEPEGSGLVVGRIHLPPGRGGSLRLRYRVRATVSPGEPCLRLSLPVAVPVGLPMASTPGLFVASVELDRAYDHYDTFPKNPQLQASRLKWTLPVAPSHVRLDGCPAGQAAFASVWLDRLAGLVLALAALTAVARLGRS